MKRPLKGVSIFLLLTFINSHNGQLLEGSIPASESSIDCYRCRSGNFTDKSCHDPFSKTTSALIEKCKINMGTSDILVPANHCIKIIGTSVTTGVEYIIRDCTVDRIEHHCNYEQMDGEKIKKCIWTCNVNGCNGSPQVRFHLSIISSLLFIFFVQIFVSLLIFFHY